MVRTTNHRRSAFSKKICVQTLTEITYPEPPDAVTKSLNAALEEMNTVFYGEMNPHIKYQGTQIGPQMLKSQSSRLKGRGERREGPREFWLCQPFFVRRENAVNDY